MSNKGNQINSKQKNLIRDASFNESHYRAKTWMNLTTCSNTKTKTSLDLKVKVCQMVLKGW